ncbi:MAG: hypothetical protein P1U89_00095 [Verrucomicrobiales bacterium]|nr:hypothetical protein [Verrucomicrobiales bacterium]
MSTATTSGRAELAAILDLAAQQDGAIRLLQPKDSESAEPGLFPNSKGKYGIYLKELVGTMLEEVLTRPRMVKLTQKGIEILIRNTPQDERPQLIDRASNLYRPEMIAVWKSIAIPREQDALEASIDRHFGKWFQDTKAEQTSESDDFKLELARELATSWSESTTDEARKRLSYFLRMAGAETFEKKDSVVEFNAQNHKPNAPLFKGDSALVLNPGWKLNLPNDTTIILLKAEVTAAN